MNLELTTDQKDCLVELTKEFLYALPLSEHQGDPNKLKEYPAFQILRKLKANDALVHGELNQ